MTPRPALLPAVLPRHATPVHSHRAGPTSAVAQVLGTPLMPWQQTAAELLEATDPDGRRAHPMVLITVQRQAGKSTLMLATAVRRCLERPGHRFWYTAQNGNAAAERWAELARALCEPPSPFAGYVAARYTNGAQCLTFPNGSTIRPFAPTRDSLHGKQADTVVIDEGFAFGAARGTELLQAAGPAQATRTDAQLIVVSTQGDAESTWLHSLIDRGRSGAAGLAYLEYGIGDQADPTDLALIARQHPAVGHTITRRFLEHQALILEPLEFARAYGNARTATGVRVIDARAWSAAATPMPLPDGPVTIAADVSLDRSRSAIVACRLGVLEVIESRDGSAWVAERLAQLNARHRPAGGVAVLRAGPSAALGDELDKLGVPTFPGLGDSVYATACSRFLDDIRNGAISYRMHPNLDAAVAAASQRRLGEGWAWSRRSASQPIPELVAATLASWADQHRPAPSARPAVFAG